MNVEELRTARERGVKPSATGANLSRADLTGADLTGANLSYADLTRAELYGANLFHAKRWGGMILNTLSGDGYMVPTPDGWRVSIGCWRNHTLDDLRDLVVDKAEWPEADGVERERRRPSLIAALALCEAHANYHQDKLDAVVAKWGSKQ